jgi:hypothetical protein
MSYEAEFDEMLEEDQIDELIQNKIIKNKQIS